jgi:anti-sigma B factor antagonist
MGTELMKAIVLLARVLGWGRAERTSRAAHSGAEHASMEDARRGRRRPGARDTDLAVSAQVLSEHRAVLAVRGGLNAVTALALKARIQGMVREGRREIVCDLGEVGSVDSSGLAALVAGVKAAHERGGFFKLVARNERVTRLLELTKLDRVFEMHRSVEDALALGGNGDKIPRVA